MPPARRPRGGKQLRRGRWRAVSALPRASISPRGRLAVILGGCRCRSRRGVTRRAQRNRQLVGARQLFQMTESELLEKRGSGPIHQRSPQAFASSNDIDQPALVQGFQDRSGADAANFLDLRSADRLTIGDDGEGFQRRGGETLRARGELSPLDRLGVLGPRQDLPATGYLDQLHAVTVVVVMEAQLLER